MHARRTRTRRRRQRFAVVVFVLLWALALLTHAGNDMSLFLACKIFTILFTLVRAASGARRCTTAAIASACAFIIFVLAFDVHVRL